jgi:protein arginine kinase
MPEARASGMQSRDDHPWADRATPHHEVVMSCRVRMARNLAGFPFVSCATDRQCEEVLRMTRGVLVNEQIWPGMRWVTLGDASRLERSLLVERHLISKNHAETRVRRAVAISQDERLSVMVNEEDHLRMQILAGGLDLEAAYRRLDQVDDFIEARLDYSFNPRWGYLTACPTNVGTGVRFSVMLHLPALRITREIERVRRAAKDLHLAVRGYYGEGSESAGDFYQVSNQVTLGRTEEDLLAELRQDVLPRILDYELEARCILMERHRTALDDRVHRALALLQSARLLDTDEAMKLLSRVRLGACLGRLDVPVATVNQLFLRVQPAHVQMDAGHNLGGDDLKEATAALIRRELPSRPARA